MPSCISFFLYTLDVKLFVKCRKRVRPEAFGLAASRVCGLVLDGVYR